MYDLLFNSIAYADGLDDLLFRINKVILNPLIEFSFIIALGVFLFGVMEFIRGADNKEKREKGRQHMLWGVIGLFIMMAVFGLITLLTNTLGISGVRFNKKEQKFSPPELQDLVLPK